MPVETPPWAIQGQSHAAERARNHTAALLGAPAAAVVEAAQITTAGGAHGVVLPGDLAVTQNGTPNMSVNVAAGRAFIRSTEAASLNAGVYSFFNDGTVNLAIAAADPTNPRRDLVVAQVRDSNYSGAANDARLFVVTGTPAAVPVDPAIPDSCLVLARVQVNALATSIVNANITDLRTRAYSVGGTAVCTSTTRPSGVSLYEGLRIYEIDTDRELVWNGSVWARTLELGAPQIWTPVVTQSVVVAATVNEARFVREGRTLDAWFNLTITGAGTAGNIITVSLPVAYDGHAAFVNIGAGFILDTSATTRYVCSLEANTTTAIAFVNDASGNSAVGQAPNFGLAVNDVIRGHVRYTVAAG